MLKCVFFLLFSLPLQLFSSTPQPNPLVHGQGTVQITSEVNAYQNLTSGTPIQGSVMVTHDLNQPVDINSFSLGDKPLKVELIQTVPMSSFSPLVVSIYQFKLDGMAQGVQNLPPIKAKVGGKDYQAPPLTLEISR